MLYSKIKYNKNIFFFLKKEKNKLISKFIFINLIHKLKLKRRSIIFNKILTIWSKFYLRKYFKSNSKTRFIRRCNVTNRNRSVLRSFGFSRIVFRNFIHHGFLPGYKKAVW